MWLGTKTVAPVMDLFAQLSRSLIYISPFGRCYKALKPIKVAA